MKHVFNSCVVVMTLVDLCFLAGCAQSTGVQQLGPDTYTITVSAQDLISAKQAALQEAGRFAKSHGKYVIPIETQTGKADPVLERPYYELVFRLVDANDPEYRRTQPKQVPDITVGVQKE